MQGDEMRMLRALQGQLDPAAVGQVGDRVDFESGPVPSNDHIALFEHREEPVRTLTERAVERQARRWGLPLGTLGRHDLNAGGHGILYAYALERRRHVTIV